MSQPIHLMTPDELSDAIEMTEIALGRTPKDSGDCAVLRAQLSDLDREQGDRRIVNGEG